MQFAISQSENKELVFYQKLVDALYSTQESTFVNINVYTDFFYKTILVFDDTKIVGHCIVYKNDALKINDNACVAIGNWECINNSTVAKMLLDSCTEIAHSLKATCLVGPLNGSTWDNYRFTTSAIEDELFLGENLQKTYYAALWKQNNFIESANYISTLDSDLQLYKPEKINAYKKELANKNIVIRNIVLQNFKTEIENIFNFCSHAFSNNFLYTPINKNSFVEKYLSIQKYLDADYIYIAEEHGKVVAFLFAYPNALCTTEKQMILKTIANSPHRQHAGIAYILGNMLTEKCIANNYTSIIHAFMHTKNNSTLASKKYESKPMRTYSLFIKNI